MRVTKELIELKRTIETLRSEISQRLDLIEYKLNQYVALNYIQSIANYVAHNVNIFIKSLKCPEKRREELKCKEEILAAQRKYLDQLRRGNLTEASRALKELIDLTEHIQRKMIERGKRKCADCCQHQLRILWLNKSFIDELNLLSSRMPGEEEKIKLISSINPLKLKENILSIISHKTRLQVMLSIFKGNNRFTDLVKVTGINGGHLLYHLNKLINHGFIRKSSSKSYMLTTKGLKALLVLAQLNI